MKKSIIILACIVFAFGAAFAKGPRLKKMKDGLYLIARMDTTGVLSAPLEQHQRALHFSKLFDDYNEDSLTAIIVLDTSYVPLELQKSPIAEQQTENKKKLLLTLTPAASKRLVAFSTTHVMQRVAIVVDGEVLTVHKIKEPLTSGQLQITRCNDNACERLYIQLKKNVQH